MCHGEKEAISAAVVALTFPPGVVDGATLRFDGKGHTGPEGEVGNLRVDVRLARSQAQDAPARGPQPAVRTRPVRRAG
jgi:DnaJ-class molecular chaperone